MNRLLPQTRNSFIVVGIGIIILLTFTIWVVIQMYNINVNVENERTRVCREAAVGSESWNGWCNE